MSSGAATSAAMNDETSSNGSDSRAAPASPEQLAAVQRALQQQLRQLAAEAEAAHFKLTQLMDSIPQRRASLAALEQSTASADAAGARAEHSAQDLQQRLGAQVQSVSARELRAQGVRAETERLRQATEQLSKSKMEVDAEMQKAKAAANQRCKGNAHLQELRAELDRIMLSCHRLQEQRVESAGQSQMKAQFLEGHRHKDKACGSCGVVILKKEEQLMQRAKSGAQT